jgi:hypothetical protein
MKKRNTLKTLILLTAAVFAISVHAEAKTNELGQGSRYEDYLEDGSLYKGQMEDDKKDGVGTIFYPDEGRLDGTWCQDKIEGNVLFTYEDGSCFKGCYRNDEKNGLGVMIDADGNTETGIWEDGEKTEGLRSMEKDGNVYYIEAIEDLHGGKGIIVYANGNIYIGDLIRSECPEGNGTMYYANGAWYTGEWKDGKREGEGILYGSIPDSGELNPSYTKCAWEEDEQTGIGVFWNSKGECAIGDFTNGKGKYNGEGVKIDQNGTASVKEWENGTEKSSSPEVWENTNGDRYVGTKKGNVIDGHGMCIFKDGYVYIGDFEDGIMSGEGFHYWPEKDIWYTGEFENGIMDGMGTLHFHSAFYKGELKKGKLDGEGTISYTNGEWIEGTWENGERYSDIHTRIREDGSTYVEVYENGKKKEGDVGVTMYKEPGYSGVSGVFVPGEYHIADMVKRGISNRSISSMKVPDGYSVTVYTEDECEGNSNEITGDIDLSNRRKGDQQLDDLISSFVVEKE